MSKEIKEKAKEYLQHQLSVLPTTADKKPAVAWAAYQSSRLKQEEVESVFSQEKVHGLGIICGAISGNLEVIDVDTKHDSTGKLWDEFSGLIRDTQSELYKKLVIAKTVNGGYHIYYRCSVIARNVHLAFNSKREILIETRGEGGYVKAPPSPGYQFIQGYAGVIPSITPEERSVLFSIAKCLNDLPEEVKTEPTPQGKSVYNSSGLSPFEDYNNRGDVVALLESKGWRVVSHRGERINLLRPGATDSATSGNYHTGKKILRVFSSSTEFNPDKGYNAAQVFSLLECSGDDAAAARKLLSMGYGEPYKRTTEVQVNKITVHGVNTINKVDTVIAEPGQTINTEGIKSAGGDQVLITSPGVAAAAEVLKAIDFIQGQTGKRIYVAEEGIEKREYKYQLDRVFEKYGTIQEQQGGLTDRDQDNLLSEVVTIAARLREPIDKDRCIKEFLTVEAIQEMGITEESLSMAVKKIAEEKSREDQKTTLNKVISDISLLLDRGDTDKALERLDTGSNKIKSIAIQAMVPEPMSFNTLLDSIASIPASYKTGYASLDEIVGFTPGTMSFIAGRPSHGKTTFMFNLLLRMCQIYPDKKFYFLSYEEPIENIVIKLINNLTAIELKRHFNWDLPKPSNYEFIKHYIKGGRNDIREIEDAKTLLQGLIDSGRLILMADNLTVEQLSTYIIDQNKKEPIGVVFIDYIQRMSTEAKTQDKRQETAKISDSVLQIAKQTKLPIVLGSQMNRETIGNGKQENMKEAGNIEEDANLILSVYCPARDREEASDGGKQVNPVELEIKTLKNREGETSKKVVLIWDRKTSKINE